MYTCEVYMYMHMYMYIHVHVLSWNGIGLQYSLEC